MILQIEKDIYILLEIRLMAPGIVLVGENT